MGLTYPLLNIALIFSNTLTIVTTRMLISAPLLLGFQYIRNKKLLYIDKEDRFEVFIISILHMFINFIMETYALRSLSGFTISILYLIMPLISALIGYYFYKISINNNQKIILFISFILGLIFYIKNANVYYCDLCGINFFKNIIPLFQTLIVMGSSTLAWYKIKELIDKKNYSIITINGYACLVSLFLCSIFGHCFESSFFIISNKFVFMKIILALVLISNVFAYNLYDILLKKYSVSIIALAEFMSPLFVGIMEVLFFNSAFPLINIIYIFLFLILIFLFNNEENKNIK